MGRTAASFRERQLGYVEKAQPRSRGQASAFLSADIELLHSLQACPIEVIVDVVGEIFLHFNFAQAAARCPVPGNALETFRLQAVVARALKYLGQVERWGGVLERRLPHGPEGKDKGLAGQLYPLLRQ